MLKFLNSSESDCTPWMLGLCKISTLTEINLTADKNEMFSRFNAPVHIWRGIAHQVTYIIYLAVKANVNLLRACHKKAYHLIKTECF